MVLKRQTLRGGLTTFQKIKMNWEIYLLVLPALIALIWFRYMPMYGLQIAFKDFNLLKGIWGSPFVGLKHFEKLMSTPGFFRAFRNTLLINLYRLIFQFPAPIIFALMINECRFSVYKRVVQTVAYLPHFLSWVIIAMLFNNMLALDTGIVNKLISLFGGEQVMFLAEQSLFRGIIVATDIWKSAGWGTIIILASLSGIDPQLYEAATIDGASKLRRIWHITLPGISSTLAMLLILRAGGALASNREQVLMFYNPLVYEVGDVLSTYMYRIGIGQMKYSFTSAAGMFMSVIGFILIIISQTFAKRVGARGLW